VQTPSTAPADVLGEPFPARLLRVLVELRRPATTAELSELLGAHHNTVRRNLRRLAAAGLLERRTAPVTRGRPPDEWVVSAGARPGGAPPHAYGDLARWLARALSAGGGLPAVEQTGREIGREIAPGPADGDPPSTALQHTLAAMGFAPRMERQPSQRTRYVLGNCPYREAVAENQPAVCALHRGITRGLLERLDPHAELTAFVARDPYSAGCLVEISGAAPDG
jgi:predicted ArsR family transcriptional regulator